MVHAGIYLGIELVLTCALCSVQLIPEVARVDFEENRSDMHVRMTGVSPNS